MGDLRVPSGLFFTLLGVILCAWSFLPQTGGPLTRANVNLYSGLSMLVFGGVMLWLARRRS